MKRTCRLVMFVLAAMMAAPASGQDTPGSEQKKLQGTWRVVLAVVEGNAVNETVFKDVRFIFKDDIITYESPKEKNTAKMTINVSAKPRQIDTVVLDGGAKNEKRMAIYELSGDTLKLCWARGGDRPTAFASQKGEKTLYMELKRVKE